MLRQKKSGQDFVPMINLLLPCNRLFRLSRFSYGAEEQPVDKNRRKGKSAFSPIQMKL